MEGELEAEKRRSFGRFSVQAEEFAEEQWLSEDVAIFIHSIRYDIPVSYSH